MTEKSILITGCSSGIGLYAAQALKKRGYRVFATARKIADVARLTEQGFESVQLDVTDSSSIAQALAFVLTRTEGKLAALFNNAGYLQAGAVTDLSRELNRAQFETNVFGPMELTRQVVAVMHKQGYGRIIQNSSILGVVTLPYYGAYNASKFALEGFSRTLRQELCNTQIYISLINPGPIQSKLRDNAYQQYQTTVTPLTDSHYKNVYQKMEQAYFGRQKQLFLTQGPDAVVKKLIHALESSRPRIHYFIGFPTQLLVFLQRILPERVLNWLLAKISL